MQNSGRFDISLMCRCLGVSHSGFYKHFSYASSRKKHKQLVCNAILKSWRDSHYRYGAPRITEDLHEEGIMVAQSAVSRYMSQLGIRCASAKKPLRKSPKLTSSSHPYIINRVRDIAPEHLNQIWTTDITYIATRRGWAYLSTIIDLYSRMPIAMCIRYSMKADLVIDTYLQAVKARGISRGVILHSDKGSQYRSSRFRSLLRRYGTIQSFTSISHSCDENAVQESFHATLKKELVNGRVYEDIEEAQRDIFAYLQGFFIHKRRHSALGGLTPFEFEAKVN